MPLPAISPELASQWVLCGLYADLQPMGNRLLQAAALAGHIHLRVGELRRLDLTGIAPAPVFRATDNVIGPNRESDHASL